MRGKCNISGRLGEFCIGDTPKARNKIVETVFMQERRV